MPGLPNPWLADVAAAAFQPPNEQGAYALAPPPDAGPGPIASMPPPVMSSAPPVVGPMPPPEAPPVPPPAPAPVGSMGPPSPATRDPVDFQRDVPVPEAAPQPGPDPHAFDLVPTMGGGAPAHEVEMRGPSLLAAQGQRNAAVENTIGTIAERNENQAATEQAMAVSQERAARLREAAYQQSLAEQEEELQQRQADFDTTARQLARVGQIDQNRFWASRSTAGKVAAFAELMLAGFRNAPSMVMKRIDDDVKAQEFSYYAAKDAAMAKQTAFSAAMAKYQNADAARAAARVASLDVLQAQLAQIAAQNKGNETGNQALMAMADLQNTRMQQVQQGIRFMPATAGGRYYLNPKTGLIYNEKEAHEYEAKRQEYSQQDRIKTADIGGQVLVQGMKSADEAATKPDNRVQLPNGDVVKAPSPPEAEKLRTLAVAVSNANQLVEQAKTIRSQPRWWADPESMKDLNRIQAELTLAFKDRGGLGALSGPDMDLAAKGTSDITSVMPGVDHALDGFKATTAKALQNRVRTIPGAAPTASGQLSEEAKKSLGGYSK